MVKLVRNKKTYHELILCPERKKQNALLWSDYRFLVLLILVRPGLTMVLLLQSKDSFIRLSKKEMKFKNYHLDSQ
jgi:hypothetical protein